jgi:hypothetical protein
MNKLRFSAAAAIMIILLAGAASGQSMSAQVDSDSSSGTLLVTGSGKLQTAKFLSETVVARNDNSAQWANAFNTFVTLTGPAQCVKLGYTGEIQISTAAAPPFPAAIRALIDGVTVNGPGKFVDLADPGEFSLTGMNWWKCGLAAGTHSISIQFRPLFAADVAFVGHRTLIIEYAQ